MWPGRGGVIGGNAGIQSVTDSPADVPALHQARGVYNSMDAAFYLNQHFQGTFWPSAGDPNIASVQFLMGMDQHSTGGNLLMNRPTASITGDAWENNSSGAPFAIGRWPNRKFGIYNWQSASAIVIDHNVSNNIVVGTSDIVMEGWIYLTSTAGVGSIWDTRTGAGDTTRPLLRTNTGKLSLFKNGAAFVEDTNVMSINTWHHFAWDRDTGAAKSYLYLDGVSVGTPAADVANYGNMGTLRIGNNVTAANPFVGFEEQFRITVGVSRYPGGTTFTPPTLPFPQQ